MHSRIKTVEKEWYNTSFRQDEFTANKVTSIMWRKKEFVHGSKRFTIKEKKRKRWMTSWQSFAPLRRSQGINLRREWSTTCLSRTFHPPTSKPLSAFVHLSLVPNRWYDKRRYLADNRLNCITRWNILSNKSRKYIFF